MDTIPFNIIAQLWSYLSFVLQIAKKKNKCSVAEWMRLDITAKHKPPRKKKKKKKKKSTASLINTYAETLLPLRRPAQNKTL